MMLSWQKERTQPDMGAAPYQTWPLPDGTVWTEFYRTGDGYLVRFPKLADFTVSADATDVVCIPGRDIPKSTAEHLYLNQVLPLVEGKRGRLVFHASAVEIDGAAIAFVGESGRGKSTLAASCAISGHQILTDDSLLLRRENGQFSVEPAHPSIRLWADSEEALSLSCEAKSPELAYTPKARLLGGDSLGFCSQPRPLKRAYFLGDGRSAALAFTRMNAAGALIGWVKHSFVLDHEERTRLAAHFEQVSALANGVEHYCVDFPRRFEDLKAVCSAIRDHAQNLGTS